MSGTNNNSSNSKEIVEALRRFCRSIELCDDYLRGYYGLKLVRLTFLTSTETSLLTLDETTDNLLVKSSNELKKSKDSSDDSDLPVLSTETIRKLNYLATSKLASLTRKGGADKSQGNAEIDAIKELLDRSTQVVQR